MLPAVPVPFDRNGRWHRLGQEAYWAWMAAQPTAGVAAWVHTGRGLMLDSRLREEVLRGWRQAAPSRLLVAGAGGRAELASDPAAYMSDAVQMADQAGRLGADLILCYAPVAFRKRDDAERLIVEYHRRLAEVGLPMILFYLYEAAGGIAYSPLVLSDLLAIRHVVGIKMATLDSVMTFQDVARLLAERPDAPMLITGEDRFLGYSLCCGGRAALIGMAAGCTKLQSDLLSCYRHGDYVRFVKLAGPVDALAQATFKAPMEGYIQRMLMVLQLQGVLPAEATFDPWGPTIDRAAELRAIEKTLRQIGQI